MRRLPGRRGPGRPAWATAAVGGERVLAQARAGQRWLVATRTRLVVAVDPAAVPAAEPGSSAAAGPGDAAAPVAAYSWPWERVQAAEWDRDTGRLTVSEVGEYAAPRDRFEVVVEDAERLLRVIRERVTASVVLQRRVNVTGRRGFTVIGRRSPAGGPITWMHEFDPGVEPADPEVARLAAEALTAARDEVGEPI